MDMPTAFKEYRANRPSAAFDPETAAFTAGWQGAEAEVRALREALGELRGALVDGVIHDYRFDEMIYTPRLAHALDAARVLAPEPPEAGS